LVTDFFWFAYGVVSDTSFTFLGKNFPTHTDFFRNLTFAISSTNNKKNNEKKSFSFFCLNENFFQEQLLPSLQGNISTTQQDFGCL
jgi:hypothetical protein